MIGSDWVSQGLGKPGDQSLAHDRDFRHREKARGLAAQNTAIATEHRKGEWGDTKSGSPRGHGCSLQYGYLQGGTGGQALCQK